ncbi:hypothetical protein BAE44_0002693 [Dichanthelium oligosanthes]|uniref:Uncharacterized protein n=1 Tax=Dichanthelium oligosanthes TaxID=888268 RepID=A0A1E5WFV8_9POAL|nr:hypothetical protein BAE44_0002693 [Dichanthelium oligosanthes]
MRQVAFRDPRDPAPARADVLPWRRRDGHARRGAEGRVASAAIRIINEIVAKGKMSTFQIIIAGMLKRVVRRACKDMALNRDDRAGIYRALVKVLTGGSVPDPEAPNVFLLKASQALLSAVVLRAPPLFGESVRWARAVRKRDDPAASLSLSWPPATAALTTRWRDARSEVCAYKAVALRQHRYHQHGVDLEARWTRRMTSSGRTKKKAFAWIGEWVTTDRW